MSVAQSHNLLMKVVADDLVVLSVHKHEVADSCVGVDCVEAVVVVVDSYCYYNIEVDEDNLD